MLVGDEACKLRGCEAAEQRALILRLEQTPQKHLGRGLEEHREAVGEHPLHVAAMAGGATSAPHDHIALRGHSADSFSLELPEAILPYPGENLADRGSLRLLDVVVEVDIAARRGHTGELAARGGSAQRPAEGGFAGAHESDKKYRLHNRHMRSPGRTAMTRPRGRREG